MKHKGVITGDIVNSTKTIQYRSQLLKVIEDTCALLEPWCEGIDFYRGDSFQILLNRSEITARAAIILRSAIKALPLSLPEHTYKFDARLSIGIGRVEFTAKCISNSEGQAFLLSGRGLDAIKKRRLVIHTLWEDFNEDVAVSTAFVDSLVSSWSVSQSELMQHHLASETTNKELAKRLGMSQQNLSKRLKAAQASDLQMYLEYLERQVLKLTKD